MGDGNSNFCTDDGSRCSNDSFAVPGVSEFAPLQNPDQSPPSWNKGLTKEDYNYMQREYLHLRRLLFFWQNLQ